MRKQSLNQASVTKYNGKLWASVLHKGNQTEQKSTGGARGNKLDLKYIPEHYPGPSAMYQCICRGDPDTALHSASNPVHFKDSLLKIQRNMITIVRLWTLRAHLKRQRRLKLDTIIQVTKQTAFCKRHVLIRITWRRRRNTHKSQTKDLTHKSKTKEKNRLWNKLPI